MWQKSRAVPALLILLLPCVVVYLTVQQPSRPCSEFEGSTDPDKSTVAEPAVVRLENLTEVLYWHEEYKPTFYFIETSHEEILPPRVLCSVEAAAKLHPEADVYLLVLAPPRAFNISTNPALVTLLRFYPNVRALAGDLEDWFKSTPFYDFYTSGVLNSSSYKIRHTSDVLRALTVWKYGGTYLDSDIILIKSLKDLENYVSAQSGSELANAVLGFGKESNVTLEILKEITGKFDGTQWSQNGPDAFARAVQRVCGGREMADIIVRGCREVLVIPHTKLYVVTAYKRMFSEEEHDNVLAEWDDSLGVHYWNKLSRDEKIYIGSKQPISVVAMHFCPRIYWSIDDYF